MAFSSSSFSSFLFLLVRRRKLHLHCRLGKYALSAQSPLSLSLSKNRKVCVNVNETRCPSNQVKILILFKNTKKEHVETLYCHAVYLPFSLNMEDSN